MAETDGNLPTRENAGKPAFIKRFKPAEWFVLIMAISAALYLVVCSFLLIFGKNLFLNSFFANGEDAFMDYFNSLRDVAQGSGVYTERKVIYPPLANLVFLVLSWGLPSAYLDTTFIFRLEWYRYPAAVISVVLFSIVCVALLLLVFIKKARFGKKSTNILFLIFTAINLPVAFTVERGNILLIAIACTCFFMLYCDSENKLAQELSLISLAVAVALKLYPVVFGIYLLTKKKYKESVRCAIYSLVLLLVPSFFFGGPSCYITIIKNIFGFSADRGSSSIIVQLLTYTAYLIVCAYYIFYLLRGKNKKPWKIFALTICSIECIIPLHGTYVWAFMLAPLCLFCLQEEMTRFNASYFIIMVIPFVFYITFSFLPPVFISGVAIYACQIAFIVLTAVETVRIISKNKKEKENCV